jgi:hypothetical protein
MVRFGGERTSFHDEICKRNCKPTTASTHTGHTKRQGDFWQRVISGQRIERLED